MAAKRTTSRVLERTAWKRMVQDAAATKGLLHGWAVGGGLRPLECRNERSKPRPALLSVTRKAFNNRVRVAPRPRYYRLPLRVIERTVETVCTVKGGNSVPSRVTSAAAAGARIRHSRYLGVVEYAALLDKIVWKHLTSTELNDRRPNRNLFKLPSAIQSAQ